MDNDRDTRALYAISDGGTASDSAGSNATTDSQFAAEKDTNAVVLEPNHSERQYWCDLRNNVEREIWRPGNSISESKKESQALIIVQVTGMATAPLITLTKSIRPTT